MSQAVFGRFGISFELFQKLSTLFLLVQGYREFDTSKILLSYLVLVAFFQNQSEIPCLNDVDTARGPRFALFCSTILLAAVSLSPSF
jgi:hypothetical protein